MPDADWRPIETAPKDQDILVFSLRWGALIAAFSSEFGQWLPRMQCPVALHAESDGVTHWMPLPIAPAFRRGGQLRGPKLSARPTTRSVSSPDAQRGFRLFSESYLRRPLLSA